MRLFNKLHFTVLGGLDQGEDKVSQTRRKVRFHLMRIGVPYGEGRGATSGGQVNFLRRSTGAQIPTMLSLGPIYDIMSSESWPIAD